LSNTANLAIHGVQLSKLITSQLQRGDGVQARSNALALFRPGPQTVADRWSSNSRKAPLPGISRGSTCPTLPRGTRRCSISASWTPRWREVVFWREQVVQAGSAATLRRRFPRSGAGTPTIAEPASAGSWCAS
jgi:hypothetical protein